MSTKIILPTYQTTLPSNGRKVKFRPFTVREEKTLLIALQEDDIEVVTVAIKNIISSCTDGEVNPNDVPYYDIEFLYLQIRSKSIGEIIDLVGGCECSEDAATEFNVDIATLIIDPKPLGKTTIKIPDTEYTIEIRHPSIDDFARSFDMTDDIANEIVTNCIASVFTDDEIMSWSFKEKFDFVESMTTKQQRGIAEFLKVMPLVKIPTAYKCKKCGKEHVSEISGYESFFV